MSEISTNLYKEVLKRVLSGDSQTSKEELTALNREIEKLNQRLKNAQALMLDGEINPTEYRQMKAETNETLQKLNAQLANLNENRQDYTEQIDFLVALLANIDIHYDTAVAEVKQKIISSIFPEKLVFAENKYRTKCLNDAVELVVARGAGSEGGKKKSTPNFSVLSCQVEVTNKKSNSIRSGLDRIYSLKGYIKAI